MFRLCLLGLLFVLLTLLPAKAQQEATADTLLLDEVTVRGFPYEKFNAGGKVIVIDSTTLSRYWGNTLTELLQQNTSLYLKTYGNGMLSTISIRGTAASHTAVLWNGVNINSMSLGLTDFSILPLFGTDKVSINPGASSALYGSDAIGGTINLSSQPLWTKGLKVALQQEVGSFRHYNSNISATYGNGKIEGKTAIYFKVLENDFPFINTTRINKPTEIQENAAIQQKGIVQDINYKISHKSYLAINSWWNESYREVQPTMSVRNNDWQKDRNIKIMAQYHFNNFNHLHGLLRLAYLNDILNFNGSESKIDRLHTAFEHDVIVLNNLEIKAGADWNHIVADINGYGAPVTEDRNDIFVFTRYVPVKKWLLSLNVRKAFVSGFKAPFAPAVGAEYKVLEASSHQIKWKSNISGNYRIPTLNDRYWLQGGNKDLLPERSFNVETGLVHHFKQDSYSSETELTGFYNDVQNWIAWVPVGNYWSPHNIKNVKVRGVEVVQKLLFQLNKVEMKLNFSYSFSRSTNEKSQNKDELGKQLVYMPIHNGNINTEINYKRWFINPLINYTGQRFTTSENSGSLPAYLLAHVFLGRSFSWKTSELSSFLKINNITNEVYHNYEYRAMPGRNYMLSFRIDF